MFDIFLINHLLWARYKTRASIVTFSIKLHACLNSSSVNKYPKEIKEHMTEFYKKLYNESESWRPSFVMTDCPRINQEEQEWMQRPFSEEEVVHILKLCDGDKAPDQMALLCVSSRSTGRSQRMIWCKQSLTFIRMKCLKYHWIPLLWH